MNRLAHAARLIGALFYDDGRLAVAIILVLALTAVVAGAGDSRSWVSIAFLVGGTLLFLLRSVLRAAPRS